MLDLVYSDFGIWYDFFWCPENMENYGMDMVGFRCYY